MTRELLERANALHNRSVALKKQLDELHKVERDPAPFAIVSPEQERVVNLNDIPSSVRNAALDVLIGGFEREIAEMAKAFTELSTEEDGRWQSEIAEPASLL